MGPDPAMVPGFPDLDRLHERHYGITPSVNATYAEAAAICLGRHHVPPQLLMVKDEEAEGRYEATWEPASPRAGAAWRNVDDATRDGAYCLVLAAAECHLGLLARGRTETRTGADYYVGPPLSPDLADDPELNFEDVLRLEVSGADHPEGEAELRARLRDKVAQARRGRSIVPALAGVVGFSLCLVLFSGTV